MGTYLTGDFYEEISCDQFQAEDRHYYDEVVFLGNAESLEGRNGHILTQLSKLDRY